MTRLRIINMRFFNYICVATTAVASSVTNSASLDSEVATTASPSKMERFPVFFEEMNQVIEALAQEIAKNPKEALDAVERFAPFPGVIGV